MDETIKDTTDAIINHFNDTLATIAASSLSGSEKRMNQNDRNTCKRQVKEALGTLLSAITTTNPFITTFINEKGIALRLDNSSLGYVTITIDPMIKDLDYDAAAEADAFVTKQVNASAKAEALALAKARKIESDALMRARKDEQKRLKAEARRAAKDTITEGADATNGKNGGN